MEPGCLVLEAVGGLMAWLALGFGLARRAGADFRDHGFQLHHALGRGLVGAMLGLSVLGVSRAILVVVAGPAQGLNHPLGGAVLGFSMLAVMAFVALAQEGVCRGWLLTRLIRRVGAPTAIMVTSLGFAALHAIEPGMTGLLLLNMFVFGLALAVWAIREGALWGPIGFHTAWNMGLQRLAGEGPGGVEASLPTLVALLGLLGLQAWLWRRDATSR